MLAFHLVILLIALPLTSWLFREALRADGLIGLDFMQVQFTGGLAVSALLIIVIVALLFWVTALQFTAIVVVLDDARAGRRLPIRVLVQRCLNVWRKLLRPSAIPLTFYLFVLLPITGFGFFSAATQGIAVPKFISGELMKSPVTAALWVILMLFMVWISLRFALSMPLFALTGDTGSQAMKQSWRRMGVRSSLSLVFGAIVALVTGVIVSAALAAFAIAPTALSDALAPSIAVPVAAFSLGVAQVFAALITAVFTAFIASMQVELMYRTQESAAADPRIAPSNHGEPSNRPATIFVVTASVLAAVVLGFSNIGTLDRMDSHPDTLVLAHRGYVSDGVENTLEALEAAKEVGADAVEMDVMQAADKGFVVIHDFNLNRLAGVDKNVKDLTVEELTQITVHDEAGQTGTIPSLEDYVNRATELQIPLLMEIKTGGLDTDDHVELLLEELESLGVLDQTIFHSLDHASVERLKELRPNSTVGYIMHFAGEGIPQTSADFVVLEEGAATSDMQLDAEQAGLGFVAWTIDEPAAQEDMLYRDIAALITDRPDTALTARAEMDGDPSVTRKLLGALQSFLVFL